MVQPAVLQLGAIRRAWFENSVYQPVSRIHRVDGCPAICQLVGYNLGEIVIKGSWIGPGRLHLVPHVNAPVADLPVRRIVGAHHFLADLTLPYGRILYDYLADR